MMSLTTSKECLYFIPFWTWSFCFIISIGTHTIEPATSAQIPDTKCTQGDFSWFAFVLCNRDLLNSYPPKYSAWAGTVNRETTPNPLYKARNPSALKIEVIPSAMLL